MLGAFGEKLDDEPLLVWVGGWINRADEAGAVVDRESSSDLEGRLGCEVAGGDHGVALPEFVDVVGRRHGRRSVVSGAAVVG